MESCGVAGIWRRAPRDITYTASGERIAASVTPGANANCASDAGGTMASARCFELVRRDLAELPCPGFSAVVSDVLTPTSFDAPRTIFRNQPEYNKTRTTAPSTAKAS